MSCDRPLLPYYLYAGKAYVNASYSYGTTRMDFPEMIDALLWLDTHFHMIRPPPDTMPNIDYILDKAMAAVLRCAHHLHSQASELRPAGPGIGCMTCWVCRAALHTSLNYDMFVYHSASMTANALSSCHVTYMLPELSPNQFLAQESLSCALVTCFSVAMCKIEVLYCNRYGIQGLIIDPYNELDHSRSGGMSETEHVSRLLTKIKRFAQHYDCHVWFVAHPRTQRGLGVGGGTASLPAPTMYDVSGSANFINKADNGVVVHRPFAGVPGGQGDPFHVQLLVRKVGSLVMLGSFVVLL